jgi:hypothetical protein
MNPNKVQIDKSISSALNGSKSAYGVVYDKISKRWISISNTSLNQKIFGRPATSNTFSNEGEAIRRANELNSSNV